MSDPGRPVDNAKKCASSVARRLSLVAMVTLVACFNPTMVNRAPSDGGGAGGAGGRGGVDASSAAGARDGGGTDTGAEGEGGAGTAGTAGTGGTAGTMGSAGAWGSGGASPSGSGGANGGTGGSGTGGHPAAGGSGGDGAPGAAGSVGSGGSPGTGGRMGSAGMGGGGAPGCDPRGPFASLKPLAALNSMASDDGLYFSNDGLTVYFGSTRPGGAGGYDIWYATRAAPSQDFGMPKLLEGVNTPDHERVPRLSDDGRMLFVTWGSADGGPADIRVASRSSTLATFSATAPVAGINSAAVDASIWFSADNKLVYFFSNRPDGVGLHDIYVGDVGPAGIADVRLLPGVNSAYEESSPVVTADGLTMYFSSSRPAPAARGGSDIWVARRAQTGVAFEAPELLPELNSPMADNVTWVSRDSCSLIVTSSRDAGMDGQFVYDFYEAVRR